VELGSLRYPALPVLEEAESGWAIFEGLRARVTLTDMRVIVSRVGHTSFPYEDLIDVSGGRSAGPNCFSLRENETIWGGIYLLRIDLHEEWVHVPEGDKVAELIDSRARNLCPAGTRVAEWIENLKGERALLLGGHR
jgi:hypothetical protein